MNRLVVGVVRFGSFFRRSKKNFRVNRSAVSRSDVQRRISTPINIVEVNEAENEGEKIPSDRKRDRSRTEIKDIPTVRDLRKQQRNESADAHICPRCCIRA